MSTPNAMRRIWGGLSKDERAGLLAMYGHHHGAPQPTLRHEVHQTLVRRGLVELSVETGRVISNKGLGVAGWALSEQAPAEATVTVTS